MTLAELTRTNTTRQVVVTHPGMSNGPICMRPGDSYWRYPNGNAYQILTSDLTRADWYEVRELAAVCGICIPNDGSGTLLRSFSQAEIMTKPTLVIALELPQGANIRTFNEMDEVTWAHTDNDDDTANMLMCLFSLAKRNWV